jgi:hypothetical protein
MPGSGIIRLLLKLQRVTAFAWRAPFALGADFERVSALCRTSGFAHGFWDEIRCQEIANSTGPQAVRRAREVLQAVETQEKTWAEAGEFLPLAVWQTRGFDADRIERFTPEEDRREDVVLVMCYRVRTMTSINKVTKSVCRASTLSKRSAAQERVLVTGA